MSSQDAPVEGSDGGTQVPGSLSKRRLDNGGEAVAAEPAAAQEHDSLHDDEPRQKKPKTDEDVASEAAASMTQRVPGVAAIKEEYLIQEPEDHSQEDDLDYDAAEGRTANETAGGSHQRDRRGKKVKGQNKERDFGRSKDAVRLCSSYAHSAEFSPKPCRLGERCRGLHDLRAYLKEGRRGDLSTFDGVCPVFQTYGRCPSGWKCRFVSSHMKEVEHEDGRKELVLVEGPRAGLAGGGGGDNDDATYAEEDDARPGVVNVVPAAEKQNLTRRRTTLDKSEAYIGWLNSEMDLIRQIHNTPKATEGADSETTTEDLRAQFTDPPFLPSEKRRLYFGPETPALAPLTTQGNLPFRRICVALGCEATYSEMALGLDLVTGKQPEWALMKAHVSETTPPAFRPKPGRAVVAGYEPSRDLKFGAQIAASQPWMAIKATEAMARLLPHLRLVDINCGCPIDLVCKNGGGSGLLEAPNKLERMVRGMNAVSGELPITAKLRIGVRDPPSPPAAQKVMERLALGGAETRDRLGAPGCAAITLHGRTRNQRYKKPADWGYIAECAALIRAYNAERDAVTDTVRAPDPRTEAAAGHIYFLGNGDCYSHEQYYAQIEQAGVDAVMIGRGALLKPWLFEEIRAGQYLDKSASERLGYVEQFARYGMEAWGTDEQGLGLTRRFLLDYLSFASRYVPVGLLAHLPPSLSDRPPAYRSRSDLEALLASRNYKDWIKISEMFLGPAHPDFKFVPKHKSNSYDDDGQTAR